jgi:hypothetical protein
MPSDETRMRNSIHSIFSFADSVDMGKTNPYDLSRYLDRVSMDYTASGGVRDEMWADLDIGAYHGPAALAARTGAAVVRQARSATAARCGRTWAVQGAGHEERVAELPCRAGG